MAYDGKRREIAFNIGLFQAQFIAEVYISIFRKFLQGDFEGWYWHLQSMRDIINADLKDDEPEKFDRIEEKIKLKYAGLKLIKNKREYIKAKNEYVEYIRKRYQIPILRLMREAGYMPSKRDRARLGF